MYVKPVNCLKLGGKRAWYPLFCIPLTAFVVAETRAQLLSFLPGFCEQERYTEVFAHVQ